MQVLLSPMENDYAPYQAAQELKSQREWEQELKSQREWEQELKSQREWEKELKRQREWEKELKRQREWEQELKSQREWEQGHWTLAKARVSGGGGRQKDNSTLLKESSGSVYKCSPGYLY